MHTTGDSAVGFASGEVGDVNKGVVPGSENVSDSKDGGVLGNLRTENFLNLFLSFDLL